MATHSNIFKAERPFIYSMPVISSVDALIDMPKIDRAFYAVVKAFGISPERLKGDHSRRRDVTMCRQVTWKIVREDDAHITLKNLAHFFGPFDHTTVIHGITAITNSMLTDNELKRKYKRAIKIYDEIAKNIEKLDDKENYTD